VDGLFAEKPVNREALGMLGRVSVVDPEAAISSDVARRQRDFVVVVILVVVVVVVALSMAKLAFTYF